ncbi:MAG: bifunctional alpha,alpha-trehalose-phosphate synthase (UDP-forming)/trehalose-phosphatase [Deltaproteobacteria bacterium]|nr:bifunctional alpha,alpha-trehalose-phosphate synthase (UDP-forming)/trehalose-phosphatase [Deltaproteobacteria bacterium]
MRLMRLVIVSNRLPFSVTKGKDGTTFKETAGGLVSGISDYLDSLKSSFSTETLWIGWPGAEIDQKDRDEVKQKSLSEFSAVPVFISEKDMDDFYLGFCNKTLWPLFHSFPAYAVYKEKFWNSYRKINNTYLDTVQELLKPGDILWIHDYHLMLLPGLVREKMPDIPIGFFLHIPFPPHEIFQFLPNRIRMEILEGILGADLSGFHINEYTQNFLRCVLRTLGYEQHIGEINLIKRIAKADTFPMGINFNKFFNAGYRINNETASPAADLGDTKKILSVDRLDYTKGIMNRLSGFELFLEKNPAWRRKVIMHLICVPSRIGVQRYRITKSRIDQLVGKINGRFGDTDWIPIHYQYKYLPLDQLSLLYSACDAALVTPLRDGMNLIAKEYIASKRDKTGVLILSEMAGAAKELQEAIIINPNSIEEIASAIKEALEKPVEEQQRQNEIMQKRLSNYDIIKWADEFLNELKAVHEERIRFHANYMNSSAKESMILKFKNAGSRIIFLDYDGTLVPFVEDPGKAAPDEEVVYLLELLKRIPRTEVVLISGRDRKTLTDWFDPLDLKLISEHGAWAKDGRGEWQLIKPLMNDWKPRLLPVVRMYADRLPGSFIEEKTFSIVWHYRKSDRELASIRVKELVDDLLQLTSNMDVQVLQGSKVIEIKNSGVNKGASALHFLLKNRYDFILAIGDDLTDEDMFMALPEDAFSIKVGDQHSNAKYNLRDYKEVRSLIEEIVK